MGLNVRSHLLERCHPSCGHEASSLLSRFSSNDFLARFKFSTLTTREVVVEYPDMFLSSELYNTEYVTCCTSVCSHPNVITFPPPNWVDAQNDEGLDAFRFLFKHVYNSTHRKDALFEFLTPFIFFSVRSFFLSFSRCASLYKITVKY